MVQAAPGMEAGDMVEGALQTREGIPISIIAAQILRIDDLGRAALRFDAFDSLI